MDHTNSIKAVLLSAEIDNAIVSQKDTLLSMIGHAEDVADLQQAKAMLDVLSPLWSVLGYGFKSRELYQLLSNMARRFLSENEDFLRGERSNSKVHASTEAENRRLEDLRLECLIKVGL